LSDSVFISYRRDKHALARSVAERLTRDGVDVFLDSDSMGEGDFPEQLLESIKRQDALIAVITEGSLERCRNNPNDFCRLEMTYALELGKKIVIVAEDRTVDLRPSAFPAELAPWPASMPCSTRTIGSRTSLTNSSSI